MPLSEIVKLSAHKLAVEFSAPALEIVVERKRAYPGQSKDPGSIRRFKRRKAENGGKSRYKKLNLPVDKP